jgi:hypothetical protein
MMGLHGMNQFVVYTLCVPLLGCTIPGAWCILTLIKLVREQVHEISSTVCSLFPFLLLFLFSKSHTNLPGMRMMTDEMFSLNESAAESSSFSSFSTIPVCLLCINCLDNCTRNKPRVFFLVCKSVNYCGVRLEVYNRYIVQGADGRVNLARSVYMHTGHTPASLS